MDAALVVTVSVVEDASPVTGNGLTRWPRWSRDQTWTRLVPTGSVSVKGTTSVSTGALPHWLPREVLVLSFQTWPVFSHQPVATTSAVQSLVNTSPRTRVIPSVHQP